MDERWWRYAPAVAMLVAVAAGVAIGVGRAPDPIPQSDVSPFVAVETTRPSTIVVHVAGAVNSPGLVRVPANARVALAIEAAGGVTPDAVLDAVNLAAPLVDGTQVVVPDAASGGTSGAGGTGDGLVHLNQATAADLETLPGVGPVLAERIVAYREEHGPFESVDDLLDVAGIGESKLGSMRDLVTP